MTRAIYGRKWKKCEMCKEDFLTARCKPYQRFCGSSNWKTGCSYKMVLQKMKVTHKRWLEKNHEKAKLYARNFFRKKFNVPVEDWRIV